MRIFGVSVITLMEFFLKPKPPFRLDLTVWALRRRSINIIDRWDGATYRRTLCADGTATEIAVTQVGTEERPRLKVVTTRATEKEEITRKLEQLLGLRTDLSDFYDFAAQDARMEPLTSRFRGVKPPRFPTVFEALANGIACQQLSLTVGITLLNRLAERFGPAVGGTHAFPDPDDLAGQDPDALRALGFSRQKAAALLNAAKAAAEGRLNLNGLASLDDDDARQQLLALRGVGRWTAEYVLLRGLGRTHVFPGDDVGARNRLGQWLNLRSPLDYERTRSILKRWHPYAGLMYFHLLLLGLEENGVLGKLDQESASSRQSLVTNATTRKHVA